MNRTEVLARKALFSGQGSGAAEGTDCLPYYDWSAAGMGEALVCAGTDALGPLARPRRRSRGHYHDQTGRSCGEQPSAIIALGCWRRRESEIGATSLRWRRMDCANHPGGLARRGWFVYGGASSKS